jgi:hypothetical protein
LDYPTCLAQTIGSELKLEFNSFHEKAG